MGFLDRIRVASPGDNLLDVITADSWNAVRESLVALFRGDNISSGVGTRKTVAPGSVMLSTDVRNRTTSGATAPTPDPFTITISGADAVHITPGFVCGVSPKLEDGGMLSDSPTPEIAVPGDADTYYFVVEGDMSDEAKAGPQPNTVIRVLGSDDYQSRLADQDEELFVCPIGTVIRGPAADGGSGSLSAPIGLGRNVLGGALTFDSKWLFW